MSAGSTELVLRVKADKAGLAELKSAFSDLTKEITQGVNALSTQLRAAAHGGAQEIAQLKQEMQELKSAVSVTQQLIVESGKKAEEASRMRVEASKQNTAATRQEAVAMRELHSAARGLAGGLGMLWATYGSLLPLLSGFALAAGVKKAVEVGSEFTYQMRFAAEVSREFAATNADVNRNIEVLSGNFLKLSESSMFSSTEIAKGARVLAQAGIDASSALQIMPTLLKFSTVGEIEMGQAAEIASGQMHAFGLTLSDVPHMLDSTAKAASMSQTTIEEMGQALRQASTVAQQFGVNVDEMNALLAVLAQRNIRGSAAGTALMNMMRSLDPQTAKGKAAFRELGMSIDDGTGSMKKIIPLIQEYADKFNKYDQISQNALGGGLFNNRGAKAFFAAIAAGRGDLEKFFQDLQKNSDGYLKRVDEQLQQTFKYQSKESLHAFENAFIEAFAAIEPSAVDLMKALKDIFTSTGFREGLKWALDNIISFGRWLVDNKELIGVLTVGVLGLASAMKVLGGAMALAGLGATAVGAAAAGTTAGTIGLVLFGGLGAGWLFEKLDALEGRLLKLAKIKLPGSTGGHLGAISAAIVDALVGNQGLDLSPGSQDPGTRAAGVRRLMNEAGGDELDRITRTSRRRSSTQEEVLAAQGRNPDGTPKLHFDAEAMKRAAEAERDEERRYHDQEARLKASLDAQLVVIRAYHNARLTDDDTFLREENTAIENSYNLQASAAEEHIAKERGYLKQVDPSKRLDILREIDRTEAALAQSRAQRNAQLLNNEAQSIKKYTDIGQHEIDAIEKKNEALKAQIAAIQNLAPNEVKSAVDAMNTAVAKLQEGIAVKQATIAWLEQMGVLTEAQQLQLQIDRAGVEMLRKDVDRIRAGKKEYLDLIQAKKDAEADWRYGAVKGLDDYLSHSLTTAKVMQDGFKKMFSSLEDALFNFVRHGKFNFKDFANSVIDDLTRVILKMLILQPLAQALKAALQGGSFMGALSGGIGNALGLGGQSGGLLNLGSNLFSGLTGGASSYLFGNAGATGAAYVDTLGIGAEGMTGGVAATSGLLGTGGFTATVGSAATSLASAFGVSTTAATAFGSAMMYAIPYIGWVAAIGTALYAAFGSSGGGPKGGGSFLGSFGANGSLLNNNTANSFGPVGISETGANASLVAAGTQFGSSYSHISEFLGGHAIEGLQFGLGFNRDTQGDAPSQVHTALLDAQGNSLFSQRNDNVGRDEKDVQTELELESKRALLAALKATDFGTEINAIFKNVDPLTASLEQLNKALADAAEMRTVVEGLKALSQVWKGVDLDVIKQFQRDGESIGQTFQRLSGQMTQFDDMFMTDAQKLRAAQDAIKNTFDQLGIVVPASNEEFYNLVHGLDLTTQAGRDAFSALMQVAPQFHAVGDAARAAAQATAQAIANFNQAAGSLSSGYGQQYARAALEAAVQDWRGLGTVPNPAGRYPGEPTGPAARTVEQTIQDIGTLIQGGNGGFAAALEYARGLGGSNPEDQQRAINTLTNMLNAYGAWQTSLNQGTTTVNTFNSAIDDTARQLQEYADKVAQAEDGITDWLKGVFLDQSVSPLTPKQRLDYAHDQYVETTLKAQHGDLDAISQYTKIAQDYLKEARGYYGSDEYARIFAGVTTQGAGLVGLELSRPTTAGDTQNQTDAIVRAIQQLQAVVGGLGPKLDGVQFWITQTSREQVAAITRTQDQDTVLFGRP